MTSSTEAEKLAEITRAWEDCDHNYNADIIAAENQAQRSQIEAHWWDLFGIWSKRHTAALAKNNAQASAAYDAAKAANDKVEQARAADQAVVKKIAAVGKAATALAELLKAVGPKG